MVKGAFVPFEAIAISRRLKDNEFYCDIEASEFELIVCVLAEIPLQW